MLERLDVDVAGAPLHGVGEDPVDQLDDRRIVGDLNGLLLLLLLDDLEILVLDVLEDVLELCVRLLVVPLDRRPERVLAGDHREDVVARDELEIVHDAHVRGIRHRHGQGAPFALERQDHVLHGDLAGDQLDHRCFDLEPGQVDRGHAVLPRQHLRDLGFLNEPELHETVAEPHPRIALLAERFVELLPCDQPLPNEEVAQPDRACRRCCHNRLRRKERLLEMLNYGGRR